jgi:hypothetical protein
MTYGSTSISVPNFQVEEAATSSPFAAREGACANRKEVESVIVAIATRRKVPRLRVIEHPFL